MLVYWSCMRKVLRKAFFERDPETVARELIGTYLVRAGSNGEYAAMIVETESYGGPEDLASHARHGMTARNAPIWERGGSFYVYLCYGIHEMLNIATGRKGEAGAVLIRGVEGAAGPGRVTKALGVDRSLSGKPASRGTGLWVEDRGIAVEAADIEVTPRIGVGYAGDWADAPLRFVLRTHSHRSKA